MTKRNRKGAASLPKSAVTVATQWDMGAQGPANQARMVTEAATDLDPETGKETPNPNGIKRKRRKPILIILHDGKHITDTQLSTADRLLMASRGKQERDPLAALTGHAPIRGDGDSQAARVDARREFLAMYARVPMSSRPVVDRVVLDDQPIWGTNPATRERHIQRLRIGLDAIGL